MTIHPELEAQILRYYHVEKWRTGTIAAQLGVHHGTVTRVLTQAGCRNSVHLVVLRLSTPTCRLSGKPWRSFPRSPPVDCTPW
jgi:DNA-binding transcriptional regulator LsrR (DeoR family)